MAVIYLTTAQAARRLGLSQVMVAVYCRTGRIRATRPGRDWLIPEAEVERFAAIPRPLGWKKGRLRGRSSQDRQTAHLER